VVSTYLVAPPSAPATGGGGKTALGRYQEEMRDMEEGDFRRRLEEDRRRRVEAILREGTIGPDVEKFDNRSMTGDGDEDDASLGNMAVTLGRSLSVGGSQAEGPEHEAPAPARIGPFSPGFVGTHHPQGGSARTGLGNDDGAGAPEEREPVASHQTTPARIRTEPASTRKSTAKKDKWYVVFEGNPPGPGVFPDWETTYIATQGVSGANYRSCGSREEGEEALRAYQLRRSPRSGSGAAGSTDNMHSK